MKPERPIQGYTLVELVVTIAIFAVVMSLISISFANIVRSTSQLGKRVETDIGGLIGLELMRRDLELAGFGLPWAGTKGFNYMEAPESLQLVTGCPDGCPGAKPYLYNDNPSSDAPAAYRVGSNVGFNRSDYLVLKGTALGTNRTCRSWAYLNYSSVLRSPGGEPELKAGSKQRAIVIRSGTDAFNNPTRTLVSPSSGFTFNLTKDLPDGFAPQARTESHLVYGVADEGAALRFPFNRSDYFIARKSDVSAACNAGTGRLYKTTINHAYNDSPYTKHPILDCAADMQVVLYMDSNSDGKIDYHPDPADSAFSAADLRGQLKEIRIYILAHEGKRDPSYLYPVQDPARTIEVGDRELMAKNGDQLGHIWTESALRTTFGPDWRNYHWKIYTIVVQPKNL